jgi:hypothetical protein
MWFSSFLPTAFAILFLATKDDNKKYEDKAGLTGGFAGFICILFALAQTVAVSTKGIDLLKVLILARMSLGVLATIGALSIAVAAGMKGAVFVLLYFSFALFSLPEAFMLHNFAQALAVQAGRVPGGGSSARDFPQNTGNSFPHSQGPAMGPPQSGGGMMYAPQSGGMQHYPQQPEFGMAPQSQGYYGGGYR